MTGETKMLYKDNTMKPGLDSRWVVVKWTMPTLLCGLLLAHAFYYLPFISDDALISLRYADRLMQGAGLTWTDGHPVEGYSNLMWILLLSLLGSLGTDLVVASRVLGLLCMGTVVATVAAWYLSRRPQAGSIVGFFFGSLFFVGAAPTAVWAIGGLEQPLVAFGIACVIPLYWTAVDRDFKSLQVAFALSVSLGILCLTRPDGPLFSVAIVGSTLLHSLLTRRRCPAMFIAVVVSMPILFYGGQLIYRLAFYGEWLPNTALVKLTPSLHHLRGGFSYVLEGVMSLAPASWVALSTIGAGLCYPAIRQRFIPLLLITISWLVYLVAIGGDLFPAYRHFVPIVVVLAYALAEGTKLVWNGLGVGLARRRVMTVCLLAIVVLTIVLQFVQSSSRRAITERWEWQGRALGLTLRQAFSDKSPLLAVTAAGCLPYWSELPSLDMLGLNDYYLPRHKPLDIGSGELGHELGEGDYILERAPDIIVFGVGSVPKFRSGGDLSASDEFHRQYAMIRVQTAIQPHYTALVWFKVMNSRVGFDVVENRLIIPGYLMNAFHRTTAYIHNGRLVVGVRAGQPVGITIKSMSSNHGLEVGSQYAALIEHKITQNGDEATIILMTQSETVLPIESIVVTYPTTP